MNLKARYGHTYRIAREEGADRNDPANFIIARKRGHIYVHGRKLLGVATNGRGPTVKRLAALPGLTVVQDGSDGINATFGIELFKAVAAIIRPKRRRRLSPEHRAKLVAAGKSFRKAGSNERFESARRDQTAPDGQSADLAA
jgi:hypothetical protein